MRKRKKPKDDERGRSGVRREEAQDKLVLRGYVQGLEGESSLEVLGGVEADFSG